MLENVLSPGAYQHLQVERLKERARRREAHKYVRYQDDPLAYAEEVLRVGWWHKQQEVARALVEPPHQVLVKASHNVGKTFLGGGLVNWWFDSFPNSITLTTAPTDRQVNDLLWKEVRVQRRDRPGFPGPKVARLEYERNWFAHGFTAKDGDAFQGHHAEHMLFIFDEAIGVDSQFWTSTKGMFGGKGHAWLCIFNPTDTSSQVYQEELTGQWRTISISMFEHPNIIAEAAGLPPPYPSAIRYARVDQLVREWCDRVMSGHHRPGDIEWPPQSGSWWRPGPEGESRMCGRWPSQATYNVWSDAVWSYCETTVQEPSPDDEIDIGCDVARFGDDMTEIHVRQGPCSLHHESHNGWKTTQTAGRLKELCREYGHKIGQNPLDVTVRIDDSGVGGGVVDLAEEDNGIEYNFVGVNAAHKAVEAERYPNRRSELWFAVAERAAEGRLDLSRLPHDVKLALRRQAMAPTWRQDSSGRRVVEPKDKTKDRIGRSPDGMDSLNLAYAPVRGAFV